MFISAVLLLQVGKTADLNDFDKGQIIMTRELGQSIYKMGKLVVYSWSVVMSTY